MLYLMPIRHVFHMKEIISTSRRTYNCGGHMFIAGQSMALSKHGGGVKVSFAQFIEGDNYTRWFEALGAWELLDVQA